MFYALSIIMILIWSMLGILYFWCAKPPRSYIGFFFNIILSGPLVWVILGITGIMVLNERRKIDRGNEEYFNNAGEN
jgi:hypothetical protein